MIPLMFILGQGQISSTPIPPGPLPTTCTNTCNITPEHPVPIGSQYEGGYYAGMYRTTTSVYAIIIPDKTYRVRSSEAISKVGAGGFDAGDFTPSSANFRNEVDGFSFTQEYYNFVININNYPYLKYVKNLNINGYNDWYIPSRAELRIVYFNLKPTTNNNNASIQTAFSNYPCAICPSATIPPQTTSLDFRIGGSQTFYYSASTNYDDMLFMYYGRGSLTTGYGRAYIVGLSSDSGYGGWEGNGAVAYNFTPMRRIKLFDLS